MRASTTRARTKAKPKSKPVVRTKAKAAPKPAGRAKAKAAPERAGRPKSMPKPKREDLAKTKVDAGGRSDTFAGMSDSAVLERTGKSWGEWIAILDRAAAHKWPHKEIASHLHAKHRVEDWWAQMVTVGYEQAKGLREKNQRTNGFAVSASKTISVPVAALFDAWANEDARKQWLGTPAITIRGATAAKSMRITWDDGTSVSVSFQSKAPEKSQVAVEHEKLVSAADVARKKAIWSDALAKLKELLER